MHDREASNGGDAILAELFEELTNKLQAGETVDIETFIRQHPEQKESLQTFLPAIEVLVSLGRSGQVSQQDNEPRTLPAPVELGMLGDFRLIRELGRGGMGIVYEAWQISLNRRVALKVLPFATALDPKQLQRFKNEAQAAGCLHHQHIVSVYGVGCERGVHFYAMQFIEGQTVADLIRDMRRRNQADRRDDSQAPAGSTLRSALALTADQSSKPRAFFGAIARLGVQAARGLEHAHQLGVVHRDIKPANLLLDQRGDLWITDFGLAHCQSQVGLTMTGDMVGTLRYMSPEQAMSARGPIDQRVDIYSLGATLYELLTLQPPFGGKDRRELLRQICFDEPRPLSKLNPDLPKELETIVLKALAKTPADRYSTAQDLADDLERFLEDKPIRARPPTLMQRVLKFSRRHQGVTITAGIATGLFLLLLLGFLLYRNSLIAHQRDEADQLRLLAEDRFKQARLAVDIMYTQFAKKWLAQQPQMEPVEREFLRKALVFYEEQAGQSSTDPRVRFETAQAYVRVGEIQHRLGEAEPAERAYNQAIPLLQGLVDEFPHDADYSKQLADALHSLGILWGDTGRLPEEERAHLRAIDLQRKLVNDNPDAPSFRRDLARGLYHLGCKHYFAARFDMARAFLAQAAALQQVLAGELPDVTDIRAELAESLIRMSNEKSLRQAVVILEKLLVSSPTNPAYRSSLAESYYFLSIETPAPESGRALEKAIVIQEKLVTDFPRITNYRFDLFRSLVSRARDERRKLMNQAAIATYRQGLKLAGPLESIPKVDYFRARIAEAHFELGVILNSLRRKLEARQELEQALDLYQSLSVDYPNNEIYKRSIEHTENILAPISESGPKPGVDSNQAK